MKLYSNNNGNKFEIQLNFNEIPIEIFWKSSLNLIEIPIYIHCIRGSSRQFLVQTSAQNLSQILNVCVKVCTKQTQNSAYSRQNARKCDIAHVATKVRNHHISLFCDEIYLFLKLGPIKVSIWQSLLVYNALSLWLKQQYWSGLSYFKLTLLANGADVCTISVI